MDIITLAEKMKILRKLDKKTTIFGASYHQYQLNHPLSENILKAYEKQYAITIPQEYREFISQLGDGGYGPFYGLLPLRDNDQMLQYKGNTDDAGLIHDFPFTRNNPLRLDEDTTLMRLSEIRDKCYEEGNQEEEDSAEQAYNERENYWYERATQGVKFLCHEGCGMYDVLIMKGAEAGTLWHLDFSGGAVWGCGILPLFHPETKQSLGFLDWYNLWLDSAIEKIKIQV